MIARLSFVSSTMSASAMLLALCFALASIGVSAQPTAGEDSRKILTVDHYVRHQSTVPSIAGQNVQIYVRERVSAGTLTRGPGFGEQLVLFVHGAGTPAEVAFDVPYEDYSWMAYLASAGLDVFAMDMTGYGRSTRPHVMNDSCNLSTEQQASLSPMFVAETCEPSYAQQTTTIASDWDDIDAVVEYLLALRQADRVSLIGWSLGGPRAAGYAAQHPEKVARIVLLAPAYRRAIASDPPAIMPAEGAAMTKQSHRDFISNWDRQVACANQYDRSVGDVVWSQMLASDPVGATWGSGVRRAPRTTVWAWNKDMVAKTDTPMLLVAGIHDKQITPDLVEDLYEDLGSRQKILIDLGCASHNAMWERNHALLFEASLQWLRQGTVNNLDRGVIRIGY